MPLTSMLLTQRRDGKPRSLFSSRVTAGLTMNRIVLLLGFAHRITNVLNCFTVLLFFPSKEILQMNQLCFSCLSTGNSTATALSKSIMRKKAVYITFTM